MDHQNVFHFPPMPCAPVPRAQRRAQLARSWTGSIEFASFSLLFLAAVKVAVGSRRALSRAGDTIQNAFEKLLKVLLCGEDVDDGATL